MGHVLCFFARVIIFLWKIGHTEHYHLATQEITSIHCLQDGCHNGRGAARASANTKKFSYYLPIICSWIHPSLGAMTLTTSRVLMKSVLLDLSVFLWKEGHMQQPALPFPQTPNIIYLLSDTINTQKLISVQLKHYN